MGRKGAFTRAFRGGEMKNGRVEGLRVRGCRAGDAMFVMRTSHAVTQWNDGVCKYMGKGGFTRLR